MIGEKKVTAIILVAGNSTRYGKNRNKNFDKIDGKTVLSYSLNEFDKNKYVDGIIIAIKEIERDIVNNIIKIVNPTKIPKIVIGGETRKDSVYNCLISTDSDIVIIHDGARPMVKQSYINNCIESMNIYKGVTVGVKSKDTIKITDDDGVVISSTNRANTWIIQTPQCFDRNLLLAMHKKYKKKDFTDDCQLLEVEDYKVKIIEGDYTNIKITTYEDINIVKGFVKENIND